MTDGLKNLLISLLGFTSQLLGKIPTIITELSNPSYTGISSSIQSNLIPLGITLMTLFFLMEFAGKCVNTEWVTLPNMCLFFIKVVAFKMVIVNSADILKILFDLSKTVFNFTGNTLNKINKDFGIADITDMINDVQSGIGGVFILIFYGILILLVILLIFGTMASIFGTLIGRIVELQIYQAISPLPLSTLVSDSNSNIGKRFLQSYLAVCLQNSIILLSITIVSELFELVGGLKELESTKIVFFVVSYICLATVVGKSGSISRGIIGL